MGGRPDQMSSGATRASSEVERWMLGCRGLPISIGQHSLDRVRSKQEGKANSPGGGRGGPDIPRTLLRTGSKGLGQQVVSLVVTVVTEQEQLL